ncbi:MAG: GGDEF domain-containing protein [Pseudomonadota bacterium]|uniref:GGDEF domain-containing protein n=1 Tax=Hyphomonas sp. BRH_c22 TaxID=1629710 RepID=UPI000A945070|nr:GGDEF domain-containing protein [Hyphomonas sp. BRH_c22]
MQDIKKRFWIQQTRLILVVMAGAVSSTTFGSWLTSGHLDPSARAQAVLTSAAMSAVVASLLLAYTLRQTMRYLRLHLRVRHMANCDDLTGLANRRSFTEKATARLADAASAQIGLLLVDIDWFKRVNDTYGHEAGDETLIQMANTLIHAAPEGALVARLGGEEFTILCTVDDEKQLEDIAETVRKATEAAGFIYRGDHIRVTISLGLSVARPGDTLSTLLNRADRALYDAKSRGRNRFALAA